MSTAVWEDLIAVALLGTERRPPSPPQRIEGKLGEVLGGLPWEDPEGAVLAAAALLGGYREAGFQPSMLEDAPAPAPRDAGPVCSPGADALLAELLATGRAELVQEWLERTASVGVRPTPERLPRLLDAACADRTLRRVVLAAGGERVRWLAALNDRWAWAAGDPAADVARRWETGTLGERLELLRTARLEDPARGLALLESTWAGEGAQDRRALIEELAIGLGPSDEGFLEDALGDRSKAVREQAAALLASLPGSALGARMTERLRPLVTVGGGRGRRTLHVEAPDELDQGARRDGIDDAHRPGKLGVRAWRLAQVVGGTPLGVWEELTGASPEDILGLVAGADHEPALRLGWRMAALRQRHRRWVMTLSRWTADPELLQALPAGAADDVAIGLLERTRDPVALARLLGGIRAPWSPAVSRAAIGAIAGALTRGSTFHGQRLADVALALDVGARETAASAFEPILRGELGGGTRRALEELLTILDLRHAITRELTG